jgi:hypothetical protein
MLTSTESRSTGLPELHDIFLRLQRATAVELRSALIRRLIEHPESDRRLRSACNSVMRRREAHVDLHADVLQEAVLLLTDCLLRQDIRYEDRGSERFGGWLWSMWYYACRDAWRHCRPLWLRGMQLTETEAFARIPDTHRQTSPAEELFECVYERADDDLRDVLLDWLGGVTLRESAAGLGKTKAAVEKSRKRLVGLFKAERSAETR